jgi:hypothetical protein
MKLPAANDNIHPDEPLRLDDAIKFGLSRMPMARNRRVTTPP